jgi:hypothetical protein
MNKYRNSVWLKSVGTDGAPDSQKRCAPWWRSAQEEAPPAELLRVALRYVDAYEYQNVLAPLLQVEADYDKVRTSGGAS